MTVSLNEPQAPQKAIGSIAHAADILTSLSKGTHSLTDIARQYNLSKSTTHRVLKLLERSNLVVEDVVNRRYYLGPFMKKLASNPVAAHQRLITCAADEMRRLAKLTEETVALDVIVGIQHVTLHEIPSQQDLKVFQESRKVGPLYSGLFTGANIKVLLSQLDDENLRIILDHVNIPQTTERTVTDKTLLRAQLNEIRQKGYAVSYGEMIPGTMCASVPVKDYFLPLALSVIGPEIRLQPRVKEVVAELRLGAGRILSGVTASFGNRL